MAWTYPIWLQYAESDWPGLNLSDTSSNYLERILSQVIDVDQMHCLRVLMLSRRVVIKHLTVCAIDERKYSSLRNLLRLTVFCLKFIRIRVWNRCSDELKERICNRQLGIKS